jgi:Pyruvate/2-oxoacid:ferredoxin oxidoreductase delta subunit
MARREIIEIDEEKCTGCGDCIMACDEGALEIVDGKAKVVNDVYCDGLGACIADCPEDALKIVVRDAVEYDEEKAEERLKSLGRPSLKSHVLKEDALACGCPGSDAMELKKGSSNPGHGKRGAIGTRPVQSELNHWPIKLKLLAPGMPFLQGKDMVLLADCAGVAYPDLHSEFLSGRAVAIGCPKFDNHEEDVEKLTDIIKETNLNSLSIVQMEVPCCNGYMVVVEKAIQNAGVKLDVTRVVVGRGGEIVSVTPLAAA